MYWEFGVVSIKFATSNSKSRTPCLVTAEIGKIFTSSPTFSLNACKFSSASAYPFCLQQQLADAQLSEDCILSIHY